MTKPKEILTCKHCKKEFELPKYSLKYGRGKYAVQNDNLKKDGFKIIRLTETEIKNGKRPLEILEGYNKPKNKIGGLDKNE